MLHKSFKPAKCKTALKLAASRIKLLKNKRELHIKQLKKELAQLLESGQDQTARIRVEHVVREEKTMAAYDLIEIYCELVATRLPIIESQKNCPIDLKEAIASLIFASPRCADVPELMDIRKHLTAKYGKEFASAAVELHPDCGVSRLLVEKLSAKAPDGPTKIKILSAIAHEHNINWEPKSFEERENQAPKDLLNGPTNFEQASNMVVEHPNVQEPMNSINQRPPNFPFPSEKQDISSDSYGLRQSSHFQDLPPSDPGSKNWMPSVNSALYVTPSENQVERMESRNPNQEESVPSSSRQSWPMEFKDATSAAQAAAEAAERASVAARAAAELSSQGRISRLHSGESQEAPNFASRDKRHQDYTGKSNFPVNSGGHGDNDDDEQDDLAGLVARFQNLKNSNSASAPASLNSSGVSVDNLQSANSSSQYSLSESERSQFPDKARVIRESSQSELNFIRSGDGLNSDNDDSFEEPKQHGSNSLHPHSHTIIEDPNSFSSFDNHQPGEEIENPFAMNDERIVKSTDGISSYERSTAVFDDSGSEEGESAIDFEGGHNVRQSGSYFPSEVRQSFSHLFLDENSFSSSNNMDEPRDKFKSVSTFASDKSSTLFSEGLKSEEVTSRSDGPLPVAFDDSDGPSSESEELPKLGRVSAGGSGDFLHKETFGFRNAALNEDDHSPVEKGNVDSGRTTSSFDPAVSTGKQELGVNKDADYSSLRTNHPSSSGPFMSGLDDKDPMHNLQVSRISSINDGDQRNEFRDVVDNEYSVNDTTLESGTELNFGVLAGGLRNKGYRFPPYRRKTSAISSDSNEAAEEKISRMNDQSSSSFKENDLSEIHDQTYYGQVRQSKENKVGNLETTAAYSDSSDDHSDNKGPHQTVSITQAAYHQRAGVKASGKSSSRTFFDSDDNASDDDLPESNITRKTRLGTGFSQRTKASQGTSVRSSQKNSKVLSESLTNADGMQEAKSTLSFSRKTPADPWPSTMIADDNKNSERRSGEQPASSTVSPFRSSSRLESSSEMSSIPSILLDPPSQSKISAYTGNERQFRSDEEAGSKAISKSKRTSREERLVSSAREQSSNSSKLAASGSTGTPANSSSQEETPSKGNSTTRESHVHPKLPDYDALTAQLMAYRQNRP